MYFGPTGSPNRPVGTVIIIRTTFDNSTTGTTNLTGLVEELRWADRGLNKWTWSWSPPKAIRTAPVPDTLPTEAFDRAVAAYWRRQEAFEWIADRFPARPVMTPKIPFPNVFAPLYRRQCKARHPAARPSRAPIVAYRADN